MTSALCPVCLQEKPRAVLTKGHIVPQVVGGRKWIRECCKCNHRISACDQDLGKFVRMNEFFRAGTGKVWLKISVAGSEPVSVEAHGSGNGWLFWGQPQRNSPRAQAAMEKALKDLCDSQATSWEIQLTATGGLTNNIIVSLYHAAFLCLCGDLPRWYIQDRCSQFIRERLLSLSVNDAAMALPEIVFSKYAPFLVEPKVGLLPDLKGFIVIFGAAATFLPSPLGEAIESVDRWNALVRSRHPGPLRMFLFDGAVEEDEDPGLVITNRETGEIWRLW